MPKRTDLHSILVIGAGPIIIGQGCEFDYAGAQACKALRAEGYRVILVNSNPATIMTDPEMADATYIEPITWEIVANIIEKERPCALLPTMGGQTALNCALDLVRQSVLKKWDVELIGASCEAIDKAEDRAQFRKAMEEIGLKMPLSAMAHSLEEARTAQAEVGFPTIIRPSFTLGGSGGGIAYHLEEFEEICKRGLEASPTQALLIEQSIIGWKEYEMEVVRDKKDNCIIICSIENIDPMGIHTGDSITVAPAQTLTDKEYQRMREAAIAVLRKIGVETGGANVQFAVNPENGEQYVIEMNPRVSRSSALASKATGFPIAKVAAKLAIGYTLDELANEIAVLSESTGTQMPASFEPTIDYVVTKIPRFNFEKFPQADPHLTTQMKSVGEVMAIGRTFQASLQKAIRGLEVGLYGLEPFLETETDIRHALQRATWQRLWAIADAFRIGLTLAEIHHLTRIDPWFLAEIQQLIFTEIRVKKLGFEALTRESLLRLKRQGFADLRLAQLLNVSEEAVRQRRHAFGIRPAYKRVDSCAGEFAVHTAYLYSTYEEECEAAPSSHKKIMVLGGGPNRIGQGIEFDYCCVHAAFAMREAGYETLMVNCNPETVSTDYDISDKLYFEALTLEDVLEIVQVEKPLGVIVQFGGQTPLKLAKALEAAGVPIIGTTPDAIDCAEDRGRFQQMVQTLGLLQPPNGMAFTVEEAFGVADRIGYPLIARPSYVLGGRAMELVYSESELSDYMTRIAKNTQAPILLDHFLEDAIEVDVDAVCDGHHVVISGIMEHIEQAGVHSGDSACSLPPFSLSQEMQNTLIETMRKMANALKVVGLINAQFAIKDEKIYVLEVNPRAARTVPFVSKVIGQSLAKIAARCMIGQSLAEQNSTKMRLPCFYAVKQSVFPFEKFPGVDPILGPEMRSTGEVMGVGEDFAKAYAKSALATRAPLIREEGYALLSVRDQDKPGIILLAKQLRERGFKLLATQGTAEALEKANVPCACINKMNEGRPHIVDIIKNGKIAFIINTAEGRQAIADSNAIRKTAVQHKVCYTTTLSGAKAQIMALVYQKHYAIVPIQALQREVEES